MDDLFDVFNEGNKTDVNDQNFLTELDPPKKRHKKAKKSPPKEKDDLDVSEASSPANHDHLQGTAEAVAEAPEAVTETNETAPSSGIELETFERAKNCVHECIKPKGWVRNPPNEGGPSSPAKVYPYTLDPFQQEAINCLESNESVLVSAHTSAGKTTVAEYAIAMSLKNQQRVIYTSPIKALSNQKYRDIADEFEDVGLMTGDVTINPNASCMIMTTEILRSMLYRGSEICREMAWVIFDEVHYMRDRERGVVWEETMILLPDTVRYVFLSATIPNSREFAEWICRIKHQPCHLIYTDYRPVPLQHFVYPSGGDGIYMCVDEHGKFLEGNFNNAVKTLESSLELVNTMKAPKAKKSRQSQNQKNDLLKVLRMCADRSFIPVIVFAFSKRDCENNAVTMKHIDLTTEEEKDLIREVFTNAVSTLQVEDRDLPQIQSMLPFLTRGIGIHHGGLLPILKEVVEILFQENLIKVLFCTETFAMGVNMPAKTVVFSQIHKWDGVQRRILNGGEFIQMAGRAGRRGKDDRGLTVIMLNDSIEPESAKTMFLGKADRLDSQFYLGYNMLLNMIRLEGADPNYLLERSFRQLQKDKSLITLRENINSMELSVDRKRQELDKLMDLKRNSSTMRDEIDVQGEISKLVYLERKIKDLKLSNSKHLMKNDTFLSFLPPGRMVKLSDHSGFVYLKSVNDETGDLTAFALEGGDGGVPEEVDGATPETPPTFLKTIKSNLEKVELVLKLRFKGELTNEKEIEQNLKDKNEKLKNSEASLKKATLTFEEMEIEDNFISENLSQISLCEQEAKNSKLFAFGFTQEAVRAMVCLFDEKISLEEELILLREKVKREDSLVMKGELRAMKKVLKKLGFIDQDQVVEKKGKLACEISSCDEILLTEIIFRNLFNGLKPEYIAALVSCLVFDENVPDEDISKLPIAQSNADLVKSFEDIRTIAREIGAVMAECKVNIDVEEYVEKVKPNIMGLVLGWMEGKAFKEIIADSDQFEGTIVRCMRRLEELLRELSVAAHSIGYTDLETKVNEARAKLRRGIIFSASLYL